jgi:hypothetical protein
MKKLSIMLALCLVIMVAPAAMADTITITDSTLVQEWRGTAVYGSGAWTDVIGYPTFETTKIDVVLTGSNLKFQIYTNFPLAGNSLAPFADMALDLDRNGAFEKGIVFSDRTGFSKGLYDVSAWATSVDLYKSTGFIYGGLYDNITPKIPITQITSGSLLSGVAVSQTTLGASTPYYMIEVDLGTVNGSGQYNNLSLLFGTGTCANDVITGQINGSTVPEPASLLFLGLGLVGLATFRKRFRN